MLEELYTQCNEEERLIRQNITKIEYLVTKQVLEPYLSELKSIAELGAGTGRYSFEYAKEGHKVSALEFVKSQVEFMEEKKLESGIEIDIYHGSATHLDMFEDNSQDIVLILGPLYHLKNDLDRKKVIKEAKRIVKSGGVIVSAYIPRTYVLGLIYKVMPELLSTETIDILETKGLVENEKAPKFFREAYFAKVEEIETIYEANKIEVIDHLSTDGYYRYISESVNNYDEKKMKVLIDTHCKYMREEWLLKVSNHNLVVGKCIKD